MKDGVTTVLFDLDGTLLPMELEKFTNTYFGLLAKQAAPYGYEPKSFIAAVWKGTGAMVKNGTIRVMRQSVAPGEMVEPGTIITVTMADSSIGSVART